MQVLTGILVLTLYCCLPVYTDETSCDESHLGRMGSGVIQSPNFPFNYPHNLTCRYRIFVNHITSGTKTICFRFQRFSLESSTPFCSFDWLKFGTIKYCAAGLWQYGVPTDDTESNVWYSNFCWTVKEEYFDVIFSSDNNINAQGFYATYTVSSGAIPEYTPPELEEGHAPCASDQYTCFNRRCISQNVTCDATDDCGDGSDETFAHARCGAQNLLACDFSSNGAMSDGYCGLSQEGGEWYRTNTQTSPYGPNGDHTDPLRGHYAYMDGTHSPAYLVSPEITLPGDTTYCLTFWYFLYGSPPGASLQVYIKRDQIYSKPEWSRTIQESFTDWRKGQILLSTTSPLQVTFGAQLSNSLSGVALDDLSVLPGHCHGEDHSCSFESSLCGWQSVGQLGGFLADLTWRRHSRQLAPIGPLHDRSSVDGSGSYLLLNASSPAVPDPRGLLLSPPYLVYPGQPRCLHFSYHMSGLNADCCQLRLYTLDARGAMDGALWSKRGQDRGQWKEASVTLVSDAAYQVVLEGMVDLDEAGEIAIDSVYMEDGECPQEHVDPAACSTSEYLCADGACINIEDKCNYVPDCEDGSDEDWRAGCPTTTTISPTTPCQTGHFRCHDETRCVPLSWVCDNFDDCADQSDESTTTCGGGSTPPMVTAAPCLNGEFHCANDRCVPRAVICDDVDDCGDGSDEHTSNCTWAIRLDCKASEVPCVSGGFCIPDTYLCNGHIECPDGFDESPETAGCVETLALGSSGIGTSGAIGIGLACLLLIVIVLLNALLLTRRKKRRQEQQTNTSSATLAGDVSTISYGEEVSTRHYLEEEEQDEEGHIYETLVEPPGDYPMGPPPYTPRTLHNMAYIPEGLSIGLGPPPTPPPLPFTRRPNYHLPPSDDPPPPYDQIIKDSLVLRSSQLPTRWLQPSTSV